VVASGAGSIVEFGSWHGRSAATFLTVAAETHREASILCVDTWLGSEPHWRQMNSGEWGREKLFIQRGEPRILESFWENIRAYGFESRVKIHRAPTDCAVHWLREEWPSADLYYIDADHSYAAVRNDLKNAVALAPDSVVSGDDWTTVRKAVILENGGPLPKRALFVSPDQGTWAAIPWRSREARGVLHRRGWSRVGFWLSMVRHLLRSG